MASTLAGEDPNQAQSIARVRMRRGRTMGAASSASVSEGTKGLSTHEPDEVDAGIDPEAINARVRELAATPRPTLRPQPQQDNQSGQQGLDVDGMGSPASRMHAVSLAGSEAYSKEYRMSVLHRLLLRNIPLDQIAMQLGVSISTVEKDRAELKRHLRTVATDLNIEEMVGNMTGMYDEVSAMALRVASARDTPTPMKLAAMRTALAGNNDKVRFYASAGVFDVLRFRRAEDGAAVSDIELLMARTDELLSQMSSEEEHGMGDLGSGGDSADHEDIQL